MFPKQGIFAYPSVTMTDEHSVLIFLPNFLMVNLLRRWVAETIVAIPSWFRYTWPLNLQNLSYSLC